MCEHKGCTKEQNNGQSAWVTVLPACPYSKLFHSILPYQNAASMYDYTVPKSRTIAKKHLK